jgi:hypothetical protein
LGEINPRSFQFRSNQLLAIAYYQQRRRVILPVLRHVKHKWILNNNIRDCDIFGKDKISQNWTIQMGPWSGKPGIRTFLGCGLPVPAVKDAIWSLSVAKNCRYSSGLRRLTQCRYVFVRSCVGHVNGLDCGVVGQQQMSGLVIQQNLLHDTGRCRYALRFQPREATTLTWKSAEAGGREIPGRRIR